MLYGVLRFGRSAEDKGVRLMERMKKVARIMAVAVMLSLLLPMADVRAGQYVTKETFDYEWYLEKHPELAALVSAEDRDIIWTFYETVGEPGGWFGRRAKSSFVNERNFDYDAFLANNPDVYAAFGADHERIYQWYITTGIHENRKLYTTDERSGAYVEIYNTAESITNDAMSEREKVKAVHDWLCVNVDYDYDNYLNGTLPDSSYYVEGVMYHGKAVCNGYMLAFEAFMDALGIENQNVVGWSEDGGGHGWNKVKVDGVWYEIDVTWDDLGLYGQGYNYNYFLISEEQMNVDHGIYVRD